MTTELKSLTLFDCDFVERWHLSPVLAPLSIQRLSIRASVFVSEETAIAFAGMLKKLDTLAMDSSQFVLPFFTTVAPQLKALSIQIGAHTGWTSAIANATALEYLEVRDALTNKADSKSFLSQIPSVRHLQIGKFSFRADSLHVLAAVTALLVEEALPELQAIYLPRGFTLKRRADDDGRGEEQDRSIVFAVDELRLALKHRKLVVATTYPVSQDLFSREEFFRQSAARMRSVHLLKRSLLLLTFTAQILIIE